MVLERDICGVRTIYIPCLHHIYPVRKPHICGVNTIYMRLSLTELLQELSQIFIFAQAQLLSQAIAADFNSTQGNIH